jgi:hypothetical protein
VPVLAAAERRSQTGGLFAPVRHNWLLALLPFIVVARFTSSSPTSALPKTRRTSCCRASRRWPTRIDRLALKPDPQTGDYTLFVDTWASLKRIGTGVGIAALAGLLAGLNMGLLPRVRALFSPFLTFVSMIPPLAILPILFISLGVDELSKVALIFLGVFPVIARDLMMAAGQIPREQIVKAITLGRVAIGGDLPDRDAADSAQAHRQRTPVPSAGVALPDRGGGDRVHRGPRLPDLPRAALSRDGRDPAVRVLVTALGYAADWALRQLILRRFPLVRAATS